MEYFGDWWNHNGRPVVEALMAGDAQKIQLAVRNIPTTYAKYIQDLYQESPGHVIVETFLVIFIIYIVFFKQSYNPKDRGFGYLAPRELTDREINELLEDWTPEPLVPKLPEETLAMAEEELVLEKGAGVYAKISGLKNEVLNFATFNFLGISNREEIREVCRQAMDKYGFGSCGPRGFYGTVDTHLKLEEDIAKMFGVSHSIIYSDNASTTSSAIPAFAKRGDLLIADDGVYQTIHVGLQLSRSQILYYKHNDMDDLERVLSEVQAKDRALGRGSDCQRRFIVTEGIFRNFGDICDLPALVRLKKKYCYRLIVDETYSFGVLGQSGLGVTEHFGMKVQDIDILTGSLENSVGSIGGFCIGAEEIVDHQRLGGAGYVYSASAAPFLCAAASKALSIILDEPELLRALERNARYLHRKLSKIRNLQITSDPLSPIAVASLKPNVLESLGVDTAEHSMQTFLAVRKQLQRIARSALDKGAAIVASRYLGNELFVPAPTIRLSVSALHTEEQIDDAVEALSAAIDELVSEPKKKSKTPRKLSSSVSLETSENDGVEEELVSPRRRSTRQRGKGSSQKL